VINSNRHTISYRFEVIADCCLNFGHFAFLGSTCTIRRRLIEKHVVDFLFVLTELSLGVMAEALRANIG